MVLTEGSSRPCSEWLNMLTIFSVTSPIFTTFCFLNAHFPEDSEYVDFSILRLVEVHIDSVLSRLITVSSLVSIHWKQCFCHL